MLTQRAATLRVKRSTSCLLHVRYPLPSSSGDEVRFDSLPQFAKRFAASVALAPVATVVAAARPAHAVVDPITAFQMANTVVGLVSTFTQPDSGLSAMLRSQQQLLFVVIDQLKSIQLSVAEINRQVQEFPEIVENLLAMQYRKELVAEIAGAADQYAILL